MADCFLKIAEVAQRVSLSRTEIYRRIARREFPEPVALGPQTTRFVESEIDAWMQARIEAEPDGVDWRRWRAQKAVAARRDRRVERAP